VDTTVISITKRRRVNTFLLMQSSLLTPPWLVSGAVHNMRSARARTPATVCDSECRGICCIFASGMHRFVEFALFIVVAGKTDNLDDTVNYAKVYQVSICLRHVPFNCGAAEHA